MLGLATLGTMCLVMALYYLFDGYSANCAGYRWHVRFVFLAPWIGSAALAATTLWHWWALVLS